MIKIGNQEFDSLLACVDRIIELVPDRSIVRVESLEYQNRKYTIVGNYANMVYRSNGNLVLSFPDAEVFDDEDEFQWDISFVTMLAALAIPESAKVYVEPMIIDCETRPHAYKHTEIITSLTVLAELSIVIKKYEIGKKTARLVKIDLEKNEVKELDCQAYVVHGDRLKSADLNDAITNAQITWLGHDKNCASCVIAMPEFSYLLGHDGEALPVAKRIIFNASDFEGIANQGQASI